MLSMDAKWEPHFDVRKGNGSFYGYRDHASSGNTCGDKLLTYISGNNGDTAQWAAAPDDFHQAIAKAFISNNLAARRLSRKLDTRCTQRTQEIHSP
jgi:hypothetical protein